ncbi:MAG: heme exporter protein CcmD [Maritimibacter sp.]|jgi:heme exporter protein D
MLELGKYAGAVFGAWGATLALMAVLVVLTVLQSRKAKRLLDAAEARRKGKGA